jgi:ketosteroid isomerase-like protein
MKQSTQKARNIAFAYFEAMSRKDIDAIISLCSDQVVCTLPIGSTVGADKFRAFQEDFSRIIIGLTLRAVHGDDYQATLIYQAQTYPVGNSIFAELIQINDGKIISTEVIYDTGPFAEYMSSVVAH